MSTMPAPQQSSYKHPWHRGTFFIKEHTGMFKAVNNYDIVDPDTQAMLMEVREENLALFPKILRFHEDLKRMTPFDMLIKTPDGQAVVRIKRGWSFFLSKVDVFDGQTGQRIGGFKQKFFTIGGAFRVMDANDQPVFELKGKWTSWEFKFLSGQQELGSVSKKWAGLGKELFTTADNYILQISDQVAPDDPARKLILAAVVCIDMVLKE